MDIDRITYFYPEPLEVKKQKNINLLHIILIVLTFISTTFFGSIMEGVDPLNNIFNFLYGIPYSLSLMGILFFHEMGHYFTSRYYGVKASFPYFIPAPNLIGTFGAFIKMKSPIPNKKVLFDIGFYGPLSGFIASIIASIFGVSMSKVVPISEVKEGISLGTPIAFEIIVKIIKGNIPDGMDLILNPIAFAGWLGMFVTSMNLIPIGQTDGGHILYGSVGKYHNLGAFLTIIILTILGIIFWQGWLFWALIITLFGIFHPPVLNPFTPIGLKRKVLSFISLLILIFTFVPTPMVFKH